MMPNWAWGVVEVTGTKQNVLGFTKHFFCLGTGCEGQIDPGTKSFYRSFVDESRQSFERSVLAAFSSVEEGNEAMFSFCADFAWSAISCLFDKACTPHCISLPQACMDHHVDVQIQTKEPGMGFEEMVSCSRNGEATSAESDLKIGRCRSCGCEEGVASFEDLSDYECSECGHIGFELVEVECNDPNTQ